MEMSFSKWDNKDAYHGERRSNHANNAKVIELMNLAQLTTLCVEILDVKVLQVDLFLVRDSSLKS